MGDGTSLGTRGGVPVVIKGINIGKSGAYMGKLENYQIVPATNNFNQSQKFCETNLEKCRVEKK